MYQDKLNPNNPTEKSDGIYREKAAKDVEKAAKIVNEALEFKRKTSLTPEEKIRVAACKIMYGTTDAEIALILGVTNNGRVNEALKDLLSHVGLTSPGYKQADRSEEPS